MLTTLRAALGAGGIAATPEATDALPSEPGAYALAVQLPAPLHVTIGRRSSRLPSGRYVYVGSAYGPGGLKARLARHLRRQKRPRWHVDALTLAAADMAALAFPGARECDLARTLEAVAGGAHPVAGFGASDCRRCRSHLLTLPR